MSTPDGGLCEDANTLSFALSAGRLVVRTVGPPSAGFAHGFSPCVVCPAVEFLSSRRAFQRRYAVWRSMRFSSDGEGASAVCVPFCLELLVLTADGGTEMGMIEAETVPGQPFQ